MLQFIFWLPWNFLVRVLFLTGWVTFLGFCLWQSWKLLISCGPAVSVWVAFSDTSGRKAPAGLKSSRPQIPTTTLGSFKFTNASKGSLGNRNDERGWLEKRMQLVFKSYTKKAFVRKHKCLSSTHRHPHQRRGLPQHSLSAAFFSAVSSKGQWAMSNNTAHERTAQEGVLTSTPTHVSAHWKMKCG